MITHAPKSYACPFCALSRGGDCPGTQTSREDIVFEDDLVIAFIASHWWEKNAGHVLIIPKLHYENLYDLPNDIGSRVFALARQIAISMKRAYGCDGISTRQHNEPAGYQTVWHYHLHVFPRFKNDQLYLENDNKRLATPAERQPFARRLRAQLSQGNSFLA